MSLEETPLDSLSGIDIGHGSHSSLQEIGELLKKTRLDQNISSKEFADNLKIGEGQLLALEDGNQADLPEPVFIRGMVQRVAEKLGLNSQNIMRKLNLDSE